MACKETRMITPTCVICQSILCTGGVCPSCNPILLQPAFPPPLLLLPPLSEQFQATGLPQPMPLLSIIQFDPIAFILRLIFHQYEICVTQIKNVVSIWWRNDILAESKFSKFYDDVQDGFEMSKKEDEDIYHSAEGWNGDVRSRLGKYIRFEHPKYGLVTRFNDVLNEIFQLLTLTGQRKHRNELKQNAEDRPSHLMIANVQEVVKYLVRPNFDIQDARKFIDALGSEKLKSLVQKFKQEQIFSLCIKSFQSHRKELDDEELKKMLLFIDILQKEYSLLEQGGISLVLQIWTQVASAMSRVMDWIFVEGQVKGKAASSRVVELLDAFIVCLDWLKTDCFHCDGRTDFDLKGFRGTRDLQIYCLLFKFMKIPEFCSPEPRPETRNCRGRHVVGWRAKTLDCFREYGYQFAEFVLQIMKTKTVQVEDCYFVVDHKANRQSSGPVFYWITESDEEAQKLLRLFHTWCEPQDLRNRVLGSFPELFELQRDSLNFEQDLQRSEERQKMVRKKKSMIIEPQVKSEYVLEDGVRKEIEIPPTQKEIDHYKEADMKEKDLREALCFNKHWDQKTLEHQKRMYHFTFFGKKNEELRRVESRKGSFECTSKRYAA